MGPGGLNILRAALYQSARIIVGRLDLMDLAPDDIECLVAIARRSPMQDRLLAVCRERLLVRGLITEEFDWPKLTPLGQAELDRIGFELTSLALGADKRDEKAK